MKYTISIFVLSSHYTNHNYRKPKQQHLNIQQLIIFLLSMSTPI